MAWDNLVERTDDNGPTAHSRDREYDCQLCGKEGIRGAGPASVHIRNAHPKKLEAAKKGWEPGDTEPTPTPDTEDTPEDPPSDGGLDSLADRDEGREVHVDEPQATEWTLPAGGSDDDTAPANGTTDGAHERDPSPTKATDPDEQQLDEDQDHDDQPEEASQSRQAAVSDEDGPPPMSPEEATVLVRTTVRVASNRLEARGVEPIRDEEEEALVQAWDPVVRKYLPYYGAELSAGLTTLLVFGPRLMQARDMAERGELKDPTQATDDDVDDDVDDQDAEPATPDGSPLGNSEEEFLKKL